MKILFQGDSITDAGRARNNEYNLGTGYPAFVKGTLEYEEPGKYIFVNRADSGDRVVNVYSRINRDLIQLKPDLVSILVGINDVWHELGEVPNGIDAEKYYKIYCMMVEEIQEALPDTKIMILEPFVLKGVNTEAHWDYFAAEVKKRSDKAKMTAEKYGCLFVPLQEQFSKAAEGMPNDYWTVDGVHPTAAGHELIKRAWIQAFKTL